MLTLMTVIRKRPEVSTDDFRRFMETDMRETSVGIRSASLAREVRLV